MWARILSINQNPVNRTGDCFEVNITKMTYRIKQILLGTSLLLLVFGLKAQSDCSEQLRLAQSRYDAGLLDEIPGILESCMAKGFTNEEKITAYKLLIQTYLFSDMPEMADKVMMNFLREFPSQTTSTNDTQEFVNLFKTYRTDPIMKIEASVGGILTLPFVKEFYGLEDLNKVYPEYSSGGWFGAEVNYIDNLFGDFDGSFGLSFSYMQVGYWNIPYEFTEVSATYNNIYFGVPLALRYNKRLLGIDFFAKGGFEPVYLLSSNIAFTRTRVGATDDITGTESVIDLQRKFDIRPMLAVGANVKIGNFKLLITSGVKFGTIMPTESSTRYKGLNEEMYQKYYFIMDDYFINQAFINFSYVFSIYNPKKIR